MNKKLCINCKWFERKFWFFPSIRKCYSPLARSNDLLTGDPPFASNERDSGNCGKEGKLFEPRWGMEIKK